MTYYCDTGTGIDKMNGLMQEYGLPIPEYGEISGSFVVVFNRKEMEVKEVSEKVSKQVEAQVELGTKGVPSLSQEILLSESCKKHRWLLP